MHCFQFLLSLCPSHRRPPNEKSVAPSVAAADFFKSATDPLVAPVGATPRRYTFFIFCSVLCSAVDLRTEKNEKTGATAVFCIAFCSVLCVALFLRNTLTQQVCPVRYGVYRRYTYTVYRLVPKTSIARAHTNENFVVDRPSATAKIKTWKNI